MCRTCGCERPPAAAGPHGDHEHGHDHDHDHGHEHEHHDAATRVIPLAERVLEKNDRLALATRRWLDERGVLALNLMGTPGAGKTTLLERTIGALRRNIGIAVIEGDQATDHDAERIRAAGARAVQINTGAGCHLDASMVSRALAELDPRGGSIVMIENVGNLVCPALFDLGEHAKVVVMSVTDGDDKPAKYPHIFRASDVMVVNKLDLLPHVRFDVDRCVAHARTHNPGLEVFTLSAVRDDGLAAWYEWLRARLAREARLARRAETRRPEAPQAT